MRVEECEESVLVVFGRRSSRGYSKVVVLYRQCCFGSVRLG